MNQPTPAGTNASLQWNARLGVGFYPVQLTAETYHQEYWDRYVSYRTHAISSLLTQARVELVARHWGGATLVDIGIGSGQFTECRGGTTYGYDVNPIAIRWLLDRGNWWDRYFRPAEAISCWDSLEHMERPELLVSRVGRLIFISLPIFSGFDHALRSKHLKPKEHFWYFTREGLVRWMGRLGFRLLEENSVETDLGREDIGTFAFERVRRVRTPVPPSQAAVEGWRKC